MSEPDDSKNPSDNTSAQLESIKHTCYDLAYSERVTKEDAITILDVLHKMECIVIHCEFEKERAIKSLETKMKEEEMARRHTDEQGVLSMEVTQLKQILSQHQVKNRKL